MKKQEQGVVVPSVEGLSKKEAVASLAASGLNPTVLELHSEAEPGTVFNQSPAAGSTWSDGDPDPIEIWISLGPEEPSAEPGAALLGPPPVRYADELQPGPDWSGGVDVFGVADQDSDGL